jgi:hypothetical protein
VTRSPKTAVAVDAGVHAAYLRDLRQRLLEPPEFVLPQPASDSGRATARLRHPRSIRPTKRLGDGA